MVLARLGVAAMLVHIGWEQAQLQKARAKRAPWDNIQALRLLGQVSRNIVLEILLGSLTNSIKAKVAQRMA